MQSEPRERAAERPWIGSPAPDAALGPPIESPASRFRDREVACLPIAGLLRYLKKRRLDPAPLLAGVHYPLEHLEDPRRRVDWGSYSRLLSNAGRIWSDAELRTMARDALRQPLLRPLARIGRLAFSARGLYVWAANDSPDGRDPWYSCVRHSVRELERSRLRFEIEIDPRYPRSREHLIMAAGVLEGLPTMLGLSPAKVEMEDSLAGARYDVTLSPGRRRFGLLSGFPWFPWTRSLGERLREAHEILQLRSREMESLLQAHHQTDSLLLELAENLREVFYVHDAEGERILFASRAYEELWGRDRRALYRDGRTWMEGIHPDDRERVAEAWWKDCATGRYHEEYRVVRPDGSVRWVSDRSLPITGPTGDVSRIVGIVEDISSRRRYLEELREAKRTAEAANRSKSAFLANVSHEIRSPMTAILGYAELLRTELESEGAGEDRIAALQTIERNGRYLLELIDEILDLSRVEAGSFDIKRVAVSPREILADVESMIAPCARAKQISFAVSCDSGVPARIVSDPLRLRQILANVVGNAVKFTGDGSVSMSLGHAETDRGPELRFDVTDSGPGIEAADLDRVFEPLYQVDDSAGRRHPGIGLGLGIAKRLCEALGGRIEVESRPGVGSTFRIRIPARACVGGAKELSTARRRTASRGLKSVAGLRLLVAEDTHDARALLRAVLDRAGAKVEMAEDGEVAVRLAMRAVDEGRPFDAILMDMQMPVIDGCVATRVLRKLGCRSPIIAVTAHAMPEDRARCLEAGCDDYLAKPIGADELCWQVRRCVDGSGRAGRGQTAAAPSEPPRGVTG